MRRDRDGSELEAEGEDPALDYDQLRHQLGCTDGWLGDPDMAVPCPVCRPHLKHQRRRLLGRLLGPRAA